MTTTTTGASLLAEKLIAAPSVTPATGLVFDVLEGMLAPLGFEVQRFSRGDDADGGAVENLFACRQGPEGSKHFAFAGHVDVVPPVTMKLIVPASAGTSATAATIAAIAPFMSTAPRP